MCAGRAVNLFNANTGVFCFASSFPTGRPAGVTLRQGCLFFSANTMQQKITRLLGVAPMVLFSIVVLLASCGGVPGKDPPTPAPAPPVLSSFCPLTAPKAKKAELPRRFLDRLQLHHAIVLPGNAHPFVGRGGIPSVFIDVEKRQGNRFDV